MKKIIGLTFVLASGLGLMGCESTASNTNVNINANLKGTNTNTGYMAPTNVAPGPTATSTPAGMNSNMNSNMKSNMNSNSRMNTNMANKPKG